MTPPRVRLKELREARGWSQLELSQKAGVRQATISEMETGKVRRIGLDAIGRIASALKVAPGELLEASPDPKRRRT